ncbi:glycosyltransferase [Dryocola sp. LX212]
MHKLNETKAIVTCCIPSYNHQEYVKDAMLSVISQTYAYIELIIIDDGSTDNSVNEIKQLEQACRERFVNTIFIYRENKGLTETLNEMLSLSTGQYITLLASDDQFLPHKIDSLVTILDSLDHDSYAAVFGDALIFSELNPQSNEKFIEKYNADISTEEDVTYRSILHKNYLPAMSALYTRKSLEDIGWFSKELRLEDWDLYLKLLQHYHIKLTNDVVAKYRLHEANSIFVENTRLLKDTLTILDKQKDFAFQSGCKGIWYYKLYDTCYTLIRRNELRVNDIKYFSLLYFIKYLFSKIKKKVSVI